MSKALLTFQVVAVVVGLGLVLIPGACGLTLLYSNGVDGALLDALPLVAVWSGPPMLAGAGLILFVWMARDSRRRREAEGDGDNERDR